MPRLYLSLIVGLIAGAFVSSSRAALIGALYLEGPGVDIDSTATAVGHISGTPAVSFTSNNVNGINYIGSDVGSVATFLGTDADAATGDTSVSLGTAVLDETGVFIAPEAGVYSFTNKLNDGGAFFVDGTPGTPGSGTEVALSDGTLVRQTETLSLEAGVHRVEFVYYNNAGVNEDDAYAKGVLITAPDGTTPVVTEVPEPAGAAIAGMACVGLMLRGRRETMGR